MKGFFHYYSRFVLGIAKGIVILGNFIYVGKVVVIKTSRFDFRVKLKATIIRSALCQGIFR